MLDPLCRLRLVDQLAPAGLLPNESPRHRAPEALGGKAKFAQQSFATNI